MSTIASLSSLPTPIRTYVSGFVALRRRHAAVRAFGRAAAFTAGWILVAALIDRLSHLPGVVRLLLLAVNIAIVVILVARPLWCWLTRAVDWHEATADIERSDGRLGERLQTVTSQWLAPAAVRGSPQLVEHLTGAVAAALRDDAPDRLLPNGPTVRPWIAAAVMLVVFLGLCLLPALGMPTLLLRYAMPLADIVAPTTTRLLVEPGDVQIVEGQPLTIRVATERLGDGPVTLHYARDGVSPATLVMPAVQGATATTTATATTMTTTTTTTTTGTTPPTTQPVPRASPHEQSPHQQQFEVTLAAVDRDVRYYATGGDATSPVYTAQVLRRPAVTEFRIRYAYPAYTKRDPFTVASADGLVEAPVGSEATITVVSTEPLSAARMKLASGRTIAMTSGAVPNEYEAKLFVETDDAYTLELTSTHDVPGTGPGTSVIRAIPDRPPLVQLLQSTDELRLHPRDILNLPFQAMDDYGVATLATRLEVTAAGADRAGAVNLAERKPTTQSSTTFEAGPERAVDGNTSGDFNAAKSTTHTAHEPHAWWEVDLGAVKPISVIELWNRTDCCPERLTDFTVFVSEQPFTATDITQTTQQPGVRALRTPGVGGTPTSLDVYQPGRFVRVQLNRADILSLAEVKVFEEKPPTAAPAAPGSKTTASSDTPIPIRGDPRQQAGDVRLDLATLNVHVGDVVAVTLVAVDTAGQEARSETLRVVVSPRSVDMATYERIFELNAAAAQADAMARELEGARGLFDAARQRSSDRNNPAWKAQSQLSRHFAGAAEAAEAVQSALLRAVVRTSGPELSVALVDLIDGTEYAATLAEDVNAQFGYGDTADGHDRGLLDRALERARQLREQLKALADGESAAAVLADLDNLKVSSQTVPLDRTAAAAQRQRTQRIRNDVAAAAKQLGLNPDAPDLENQLRGKVDHAARLAKSKGMQNYEDEARGFMNDLKDRARRQLTLDDRMGATAQAEAVRPDSDLVRARDLHLATAAAQRLQALAAVRRLPAPGSGDDPRDAFPKAIGAIHREHDFNRRTNPNADEFKKVRVAAAEARKKLEAWAAVPPQQQDDEETFAGDAGSDHHDAYNDLRELERLAMEANVDAVLRDYEEMARRDREIAERLAAARRGPPTAADAWSQRFREQIERAIARARELDALAKRQDALREDTDDAAKDGEAGKAEASELAEQQDELAEAIERAARAGQDAHDLAANPDDPADAGKSFGEQANDRPDSRLAAAEAIQRAQEQLAAMPQQLNKTQRAAANQREMKGRAQQARQAAEQAPAEQKPAAGRAADAAADQLREAETRLWETARPVEPEVARAMTEALEGFDPETLKAVGTIDRQLAPALASLKRSAAAGDEGGVSRAVDDARRAIDQVQGDLRGAQEALVERDPLVAAKWFASTAASKLAEQPPDFRAATANQRSASLALDRAWNESIRQAAAARLAGVPSMAPAFLPSSSPGAIASAAPGSGQGQAQAGATAGSGEDGFLREWGRLQWRQPDDLNVSAHESDPPGYQDALRAYFEALGQARQDAPAPGGAKP